MKSINLLYLTLAAGLLLSGCATKSTTDLPNLACVDSARNIWRCGQPTAAGVAKLVSMGVTNTLKLNLEPEPANPAMMVDALPIDLGKQLVHLPEGDRALLWVKISILPPGSVIHCLNGWDRTGLACAEYHVVVQGWSNSDAEHDMLAHGFHKELLGLWDAWEDFKP